MRARTFILLTACVFFTAARAADDVKTKLKTKVSFEFIDKSLEDAVNSIGKSAGVDVTVDPAVLKLQTPMINLKVKDMEASLALEWVVKLAEIGYIVRDKDVHITTVDAAKADAKKPK